MNEPVKTNPPTIDEAAVREAMSAFYAHERLGEGILSCMGAAIQTYLHHTAKLKNGLPTTELPVHEVYPDIHDRYIALQERQRALTIISEAFADVQWNENADPAEFSLFLALIQHEIEGE